MTFPEQSAPPPQTGVEEIDRALEAIDLGDDVSAHHEQLAAALEVLQQALNGPSGQR